MPKRAKLSQEQQKEIRRLFFKEHTPVGRLMQRFGVSRSTLLKVTGGTSRKQNTIERSYF